MAKGLQDALRAAAFDKKYGDFEFEEEEEQQENIEYGTSPGFLKKMRKLFMKTNK